MGCCLALTQTPALPLHGRSASSQHAALPRLALPLSACLVEICHLMTVTCQTYTDMLWLGVLLGVPH